MLPPSPSVDHMEIIPLNDTFADHQNSSASWATANDMIPQNRFSAYVQPFPQIVNCPSKFLLTDRAKDRVQNTQPQGPSVRPSFNRAVSLSVALS